MRRCFNFTPRGLPRMAVLACVLIAGCTGGTAATHSTSEQKMPGGEQSQPPSAQSFTAFVGTWLGHSRDIVIRADGTFSFAARLYRDCGQDPPPCDEMSGNEMILGDRGSGKLLSVAGEQADGVVVNTTDQTDSPKGADYSRA